MASGGSRAGAGRPKGLRNRQIRKDLLAAERGGILPRDFLLQIMRDETQELPIRIEAAKSVSPYIHAKLVSVDTKIDQSITVEIIRL